jgi:hypothetical protein
MEILTQTDSIDKTGQTSQEEVDQICLPHVFLPSRVITDPGVVVLDRIRKAGHLDLGSNHWYSTDIQIGRFSGRFSCVLKLTDRGFYLIDPFIIVVSWLLCSEI